MDVPLITDKGYFSHEPLYIEQASENNGMPADIYEANRNAFNTACLIYERKYLKLLMGEALRNKFIDEVDADTWAGLKAILWEREEPSGPDQDYVYSESPVADYIYFWYLNDHSASYNGQNFRQAKSETSVMLSVVQKQIWVWEHMKVKTREAMGWLNSNSSVFADIAIDKTGWPQLLTNYNSAGI